MYTSPYMNGHFVNTAHCSWSSWNKHAVLGTTIHVQYLIMLKKETSVEPDLQFPFEHSL